MLYVEERELLKWHHIAKHYLQSAKVQFHLSITQRIVTVQRLIYEDGLKLCFNNVKQSLTQIN